MTESSNIRLLVVEDDPLYLSYIIKTIARLMPHAIVDEAACLHDVKQKVGAAYDMILVDYNLPDSTGLDTLAEVAELFEGSKIISMSAYTKDEWAYQSGRIGGLAFIPKGENFRTALRAAMLNVMGQADAQIT